MPQILFAYSLWWLIPIGFLSLGIALLLYWKNPIFQKPWNGLNGVLIFLRTLVLFLLGILLLQPVLRFSSTRELKPYFIAGVDVSESVSAKEQNEAKNFIKQLKEKINDKAELILYHFANGLALPEDSSLKRNRTNLANFIQESEKRHGYRPIAGVLLASDGIANQGAINEDFNRFPIHTLALGDTSSPQDLRVKQVRTNDVAFLGNTYPVSIRIEAKGLSGKKTQYSVSKNGKQLISKEWQVVSKNDFLDIALQIPADSIGLQRFLLEMTPINGEQNTVNNKKEFYVEVLKGKQKILLLSPYPHPDAGAIRQCLETSEETDLTFITPSSLNEAGALNQYQLVIALQTAGNRGPFAQILREAQQQGISLLIIGGMGMNYPALRDWNIPLQTSGNNSQTQDAFPVMGNSFKLFNVDKELADWFKQVPPLTYPFMRFDFQGNPEILATARIGQVETPQPLIAFWNVQGRKIGLILGEGLWRWRIHAYQKLGTHQLFDEWFKKMAQFLGLKEDNRPFKVNPSALVFEEDEPVMFEATLKNPTGEYITGPDVKIEITESGGKSLPFQFSKDNLRYQLSCGILLPGNYQYKATTFWHGKTLEVSGYFAVKITDTELADLTANHGLLRRISELSGGYHADLSHAKSLFDSLSQSPNMKSRLVVERQSKELIEWPWYYVMIMFFLSIEWVMRRWEGVV